MELYLVIVKGYIRNGILNGVQKILYSDKVLGRNSTEPTVINSLTLGGSNIVLVTNKELPSNINLIDFYEKIISINTDSSICEFILGGYAFKVQIVEKMFGYDYEGDKKIKEV